MVDRHDPIRRPEVRIDDLDEGGRAAMAAIVDEFLRSLDQRADGGLLWETLRDVSPEERREAMFGLIEIGLVQVVQSADKDVFEFKVYVGGKYVRV